MEKADRRVSKGRDAEYYRALEEIAIKAGNTRENVGSLLEGGSILEEWGLSER